MKYADLHVHTNFSDGTFTPAEAVEYASKNELAVIGITDHDITDGIQPTLDIAKNYNIEVVPGVELSVEMPIHPDLELHLLGYFINWQDEHFQERLKYFRQMRRKRAEIMLAKLQDLKVFLDGKKLLQIGINGAVGRLHFAQAMLEEGYVNNIQEAFQRYIGYGKPAYVPKVRLLPEEAIKLILQIKGIPVIAHPYFSDINPELIRSLVNMGLKGIEVYHPKHSNGDIERFLNMAKEFNLLITGGSDCHGNINQNETWKENIFIPYEIVEKLKELHQKNLSTP